MFLYFVQNDILNSVLLNPDWNLDIGLLVKTNEDLRKFLTYLREKFEELIEINDIYFIPEITKENIAPDILFE